MAGTKEAGNFLIRQAEGKQRELHKCQFPELDLRKRVGSCTLAKMSGPGTHLPSIFSLALAASVSFLHPELTPQK